MLTELFHLLTLFPFVFLGWRAMRPRRQPVIELGPEEHLDEGQLSALQREFLDDREPIHPSVEGLLKYLDPIANLSVVRCADAGLEWGDPRSGARQVRMRQCRSFWCPWCIRRAHHRRGRFQYAKLQSVQPPGEDALRIFNIVAELPVPLHALVRDDAECMNAWLTAIRRTFADTFRYKGRKGASAERACWESMGAIFNFHAIGDAGTPWPKWFPHWDILVSAYRLRDGTLERVNANWPESFDKTRAHYRERLREAFLPMALEGKHQNAELETFLRTDFDVIWHVGRPRKGSGEGYVHIRNAGHRVRYSCRPLFGLDRCRLEQDDDGKDLLVYTPMPKAKRRIEHAVKPGPAFGALRHMKKQLSGRYTHRLVGILKGEAYAKALKVSGRPAVKEQEKSGKKLLRAWIPQEGGGWMPVEPRDLVRY